MSLLAISIISGLALFLVVISGLVFSLWLFRLNQQSNDLTLKNQSADLLCSELQLANHELKSQLNAVQKVVNHQLLENTQVSKQLEHRIKQLQHQLATQQKALDSWQENQGQDKLYSRAFKLAEKGAGIDEIIVECELPRAEAEMLLSVYRQRKNA
jgi:hypothetical protein